MTMGRFHYTKATVSAQVWCNVCGRETEHRIDNGRRGPCLNPDHARQPKLVDIAAPAAVQDSLFEDSGPPGRDRG
jgi:hypothetical protein